MRRPIRAVCGRLGHEWGTAHTAGSSPAAVQASDRAAVGGPIMSGRIVRRGIGQVLAVDGVPSGDGLGRDWLPVGAYDCTKVTSRVIDASRPSGRIST